MLMSGFGKARRLVMAYGLGVSRFRAASLLVAQGTAQNI